GRVTDSQRFDGDLHLRSTIGDRLTGLGVDRAASRDLLDDLDAFGHRADDRVVRVEHGVLVHDEELATGAVWRTALGHRQGPLRVWHPVGDVRRQVLLRVAVEI